MKHGDAVRAPLHDGTTINGLVYTLRTALGRVEILTLNGLKWYNDYELELLD